MKRKLLIILVLFTALFNSLFSYAYYAHENSEVIAIRPADQVPSSRPNRNGADVPITAYFDGFTSTVFISFSNDLGDVDTEITNLYTSETQYEVVDAYDSPVAIPITGTSGLYSIVFTLSSGAQYIGEFEITGE